MNQYFIGSFLAPFFLVMVFIPIIKRLAINTGFVEHASPHKLHVDRIPLGGGLAIFLAMVIAVIMATSLTTFSDSRSAIGLMAGAILVFLIGLYDDSFRMGIWSRMLGQILAALIFLSFFERAPLVMSLPVYLIFGTVWIVGILNAFEFLDNMDGLCAGVSLAIALGLGILFVLRGMPLFAIISFSLAGGALGFLRYNLPPAGIYLGSIGSQLFGYALACLAIVHLTSSRSLSSALAPLIIMAYPIFDLTFVTISRLNEGRKVYLGGKDHSSHKISFLGLTRKTTVITVLLVNLVLVTLGIVLFFIAESPYQTLIIIVLAFILAFAGTHLYRNILYLRYKISYLLIDIIAINIGFFAYLLLKYPLGLTGQFPAINLQELVIPLAWINVYWILIYSTGGLYDLPLELRFSSHIKALLRLVIIGLLIFAFATFRSQEGFQTSWESLVIYGGLLIVCNLILRFALYIFQDARQANPRKRRDAVVAKLHPGVVNPSLLGTFSRRFRINGYVGKPPDSFEGFLGPIERLSEALRVQRVARIILDIPEDNYDDLTPIFSSAYFMETRYLTDKPNHYNLRGLHKYRTRYNGIYLVSISQKKIFIRLIKRVVDFFISGFLLILTSRYIVFRMVSARYRRGNILHKVTIFNRGGNEKVVRCTLGADGKYQFRNFWGLLAVFRGDISFVGATIVPKEISIEECPDELPGQWRKYLTKPGLYGPGYRGKTPEERFELDLEYIEKASLLRDLGVIFRQIVRF
jgi:UDP-GlcNAc:undecaprenyl-phosphate/decaprenyl-phosphate GlcNAc-1-phosphate transferase